jgi:peptide/nickel transport system ATP-binding protein
VSAVTGGAPGGATGDLVGDVLGPGEPGAPLLEVRDLGVSFLRRGRAPVRAVEGVSFTVETGRTVGLVGESGSGKSVTALSIMGLLPRRGVAVTGEVHFAGESLTSLSDAAMREIRGRDVAMVFQDPMSSLNPVITVGLQLTEVLRRHRGMSPRQAREEGVALLDRVGIPDPRRRMSSFPHQLSGGMRQRALIAMAVACRPKLLIADEPTTALDVTIQAQILELLAELVRDAGTALLLITHDLGIVAGVCDEVHVMYSGRIVESASRRDLFRAPRHPYTHGLLGSIPRLDTPRGARLEAIPGSPTQVLAWERGCAFQPRCGHAIEVCSERSPELVDSGLRRLRCHNPVGPDAGPDGPAEVDAAGFRRPAAGTAS